MNKKEIAEYLEANDSVYCQNISGQIVSHTFTGAGKVVPFTWKKGITPVCLTDVVPKVLIIGDTIFENLILRNKVRLLEREQYMEMIGQPVASVSKPVIIPEAVDAEPEDLPDISVDGDAVVPVITGDQTPDMVKQTVIELVSACNAGETTVKEATAELEDIEDLTADDLEYIINECSLKGVVKVAEKLLKKLD